MAINSTAIELQWMEPHGNNETITAYIVRFQQPQLQGGEDVNQTFSSETKRAIFTELYPGVTYVFTVAAINILGIGNASAGVHVRTLDERKYSTYNIHVYSRQEPQYSVCTGMYLIVFNAIHGRL